MMMECMDLASLTHPSRSRNRDRELPAILVPAGGLYLSIAISRALFSCAELKDPVAMQIEKTIKIPLKNRRSDDWR